MIGKIISKPESIVYSGTKRLKVPIGTTYTNIVNATSNQQILASQIKLSQETDISYTLDIENITLYPGCMVQATIKLFTSDDSYNAYLASNTIDIETTLETKVSNANTIELATLGTYLSLSVSNSVLTIAGSIEIPHIIIDSIIILWSPTETSPHTCRVGIKNNIVSCEEQTSCTVNKVRGIRTPYKISEGHYLAANKDGDIWYSSDLLNWKPLPEIPYFSSSSTDVTPFGSAVNFANNIVIISDDDYKLYMATVDKLKNKDMSEYKLWTPILTEYTNLYIDGTYEYPVRMKALLYLNNKYIAFIDNGIPLTIVSSEDGIIWTQEYQFYNGASLLSLETNGTAIVLSTYAESYSIGQTTKYRYYTSLDYGKTWELTAIAYNQTSNVSSTTLRVANGRFFASTYTDYYTSTDGITWEATSVAEGYYFMGTNFLYANNLYINFKSSGTFYYSTDAITWHVGDNLNATSIVWYKNRWYIGNSNSTKKVYYYDDITQRGTFQVLAEVQDYYLHTFEDKLYAQKSSSDELRLVTDIDTYTTIKIYSNYSYTTGSDTIKYYKEVT